MTRSPNFEPQFRCQQSVRGMLAMWCILLSIVFVPGCKDSSGTVTKQQNSFRIVSLSPALTDILIDLELSEYIVGRDSFDEQLDPSIPRVGDLSNLDVERLIALAPTDIVLQAGKRGSPSILLKLAESQGWNIINLQIDALDDIQRAINELSQSLSFKDLEEQVIQGINDTRSALIIQLREMQQPLKEVLRSQMGSVLLLYFMDPPSAFGPRSYLGDAMESMGVMNTLQSGGAWQELDAESLVRLDPWAIVIIQTGPKQSVLVAELPERMQPLNLRASTNSRIISIQHPQALLPGSCVVEVGAQLRTALRQLGTNTDSESEESN